MWVAQVSIEEPPWVIGLGLAESVQDGAEGGTGVTVTVVEQRTEPPEPVAVPV